ncbi:hypothetical protein [Vibrio phage LP.1]|nr:hypothetical protein [Vibrio phage LP.1]
MNKVTTKDMILFFIPHFRTISKSKELDDGAILTVEVMFLRWFKFTQPMRTIVTYDYSNVDFGGDE